MSKKRMAGENEDSEKARRHEARAARARGAELWREEQEAAALAEYRNAVTLDPGYARGWLALGQLLLEVDEHELGLEACRTAAELKPQWAAAHVVLAMAQRESGAADLALASARTALGLPPGSTGHRERILAMLQQVGLYEESVVLCEEEVAAAPHEPDALARLAAAYFAADRGEEAAGLFRRILAEHPTDAASRMSLLQILYTSGDLEGCLAEGRHALSVEGMEPRARAAIEKFVRRVFLEVSG